MDVTVRHVDSGRSCVIGVSDGGTVLGLKIDALEEMFAGSVKADREAAGLAVRIEGCEEELDDEERVANTGLEDGDGVQLVQRWPEVMAPHVYPTQTNNTARCIALSRCGTLCAVGYEFGKISVFDTRSAKTVAEFRHGCDVKWSVFSLCGTWLATCSENDTCVWRTATWEQAWDLKDDGGVWGAAWTHCGRFVSGNVSGRVRVWDMEDPPNATVLDDGHSDAVLGISASTTRIFTGSGDSTIRVYDISSLAHTGTLDDHASSVHHIALTEDEQLLVSCSENMTVKVWCTASLSCLRTVELDVGAYLVAVSGRNDVVAVSSLDHSRLLRLSTLEPLGTVPSQGDGIAFSRCGRWVFTPGRGSASVQAVCDVRPEEEQEDGE